MKKILFCIIFLLAFDSQSQIRKFRITGMSVSFLEYDSWTEWTNLVNMGGIVTLNFNDLRIKITTEESTSTFDIISFDSDTDSKKNTVIIFKCVTQKGDSVEVRMRGDYLIITLNTVLIGYSMYPLD